MKLVLKDGSQIVLAMGNNQNQFIVAYSNISQLTNIEALLTAENLSDAHYEVNGVTTETLKNKVLSGSSRNLITKKVTYYLSDAKTVENESLKANVAELSEENSSLKETIDELETMVISLTTEM